ncbi:hypothetical protein EMCRGX_G026205 [Ephydatia muelleri]
MQIPADEWRRFTHKQRRSLINKERRRRRRERNAIVRENEERAVQAQLESEADYLDRLVEAERLKAEEERKEEAKRLLDHEAWLERERVAAEEYCRKREHEEKRKRDKEERERLIREEWEVLQAREKQVEEKRERTRREKEERLKEALNVDLETVAQGSQPWHNPLAPSSTVDANFGTEKDTHNCAFFLKTGACRFGDRCSKQHPRPASSVTLLIPGMFESFGLKEQMLDERDQDTGLEFDEREQFAQFEAFFKDVLPEFSKAGKVVQFKVSCNHEPHLRGNVYVQEEECAEAFRIFNGRWYAQRQLSCEYCPVQKWKTAICGLFDRGRCPKGKHCNFLHVFRNPGGAFAWADRDQPEPSEVSERRTSPHRSSKQRHRSRSRESRDSSRDAYRSHSRESRGSTRDLHRSHSRDTPRDLHQSHFRDTARGLHRSHSSESTHRSHSRDSSHKRHKKKHKHKKHSSSPLVTKAVPQDGQTATSAVTPVNNTC